MAYKDLSQRTAEMNLRQKAAEFESRFVKIMGSLVHTRIKWTRAQMRRALQPVVYIFWESEDRRTALYVGKAAGGISRPLQGAHHRSDARDIAAGCDFLLCRSNADAERLEARLIRWLRPRFNKAGMRPLSATVRDIEKEIAKDMFYSK